MKAIVLSLGTRGDVEPFLAIAQILQEKEWEVICVFPEQFRETVEEMGLAFRGFDKGFLELLDSKEARLFMGGEGSLLRRFGFLVKMARKGITLSKNIVTLQHEVQKQESPDLVIYHPKCNYSLLWGMANPGKSMLISPVPGTAHPIKHTTILGNFGKPLNLLMAWLTNFGRAVVLKKYARKYRDDYPGLKASTSSIKKAMLQKEKTLYTISNTLFPRPDYWPSNAQVVGYYERDKTLNWQPDDALLGFLDKHQKIVFISFGSMTNADPGGKTKIIVEVLRKNKIPAIINTSWGGLEKVGNSPDHIHFVSNIPYDWIFPRVYAAVHHGGSGTTHTALKYACPSLLVPHIIDQFFWGKTIAKLSLGPSPLPIKKLNTNDFETRLLDLMSNENYEKNAQLTSEKMREESDKEQFYQLIAG